MASADRRFHVRREWAADWAALPAEEVSFDSGRGAMRLLRHPRGPVLERPYRHGGVRRKLLPTVFFRTRRPRREFEIHCFLFKQGVAVAEPVGWAERPALAPFFWRYDYYTRCLENAIPLPGRLRAGRAPRALLGQVADILHSLHRHGVVHADLNLNNWLVSDERVYLIDFDKATRARRNAERFVRGCLQRMARSGVKLGLVGRRRAFFRLAVETARRFDLDVRELLAGMPRSLTRLDWRRRLRWRLSGGRRDA